MKKKVKAVVLPLPTDCAYQEEQLLAVISRINPGNRHDNPMSCGSLSAELAYMTKRARVMEVELEGEL